MEGTIKIHIEKLPEGLYLATSNDIQGLVAQGRTITETMEIARDVCKKLIESGIPVEKSVRLENLKAGEIKKIKALIDALHPDLQYDYQNELDALDI